MSFCEVYNPLHIRCYIIVFDKKIQILLVGMSSIFTLNVLFDDGTVFKKELLWVLSNILAGESEQNFEFLIENKKITIIGQHTLPLNLILLINLSNIPVIYTSYLFPYLPSLNRFFPSPFQPFCNVYTTQNILIL